MLQCPKPASVIVGAVDLDAWNAGNDDGERIAVQVGAPGIVARMPTPAGRRPVQRTPPAPPLPLAATPAAEARQAQEVQQQNDGE